MSLKDKAKSISLGKKFGFDKKIKFNNINFEYDDVKEAILKLENSKLVYSPSNKQCPKCRKEKCIYFEKWNKNKKEYFRCKDCHIKAIFGDWKR